MPHFMRRILLKCRRQSFPLLLLLSLAVLSPSSARGQSSTSTARTPGVPAGSYHLGDADAVNLFNGNLNYHLPLLNVGGRGEAHAELGVVIEGQWDLRTKDIGNGNEQHVYSFNQPNPLAFVGRVDYGVTLYNIGTCGNLGSAGSSFDMYRGAMTYVEPDGTQHALRDRVIHGREQSVCAGNGFGIGNVFESTDDSFITFVTDANMHLACSLAETPCADHVTGYLFLLDGSKSRVVDSQIQWTQDRNGNKIDYAYEPGGAKRLTTITDSLGRQVHIEYDVSRPSPVGLCTKIAYKGFNNQDREILVSADDNLSNNLLRTTQPGDPSAPVNIIYDDPNDNVSIQTGGATPGYVRAVWLPNGRSYQFKYNVLSQLARIELPTGGAIEYDYADTSRLPFEAPPNTGGNPGITNAVSVKRVYNVNNMLVSKTVFSTPTSYTAGVMPASRSGVVRDAEALDPAGNRLSKSRHYFYGVPNGEYGLIAPWWHGKEFRSEAFAADGNTILRVSETDWRQRAPSWCASVYPCNTNPTEQSPTNNPFIVETKTTLADVNLVSKVSSVSPSSDINNPNSWAVDAYNNRTDVWEYGFGTGQPGALLRHTHTIHINNVTSLGSIYLFSRPDTTSVYGFNPVTGQEYLASAT